MSDEKNISFEEAYEKLEQVLANLENPESTLEEAFQNYKEGVSLVQLCNQSLDQIEKEVKVLSQEGTLDDFQ